MITLIKSVIHLNIKDRKNTLFMIFFPVFLVLVIGTTLTNLMGDNQSYELTKSNIYYYSEDNNRDTIDFLISIMEDIKSDKNIELFGFKEAESLEQGKRIVRTNRDIFIVQKDGRIEFYSNDQSLIKPTYVYGTLKSILKEKELKQIVYKNYSLKNREFKEVDFKSEVNEVLIEKGKTPSSMDYYGIAELGLIVFYFVGYSLNAIRVDTKIKIKDRIIGSGISNFKYYLSEFIGISIYSYVSILISYIICNLVFEVNYGSFYLLPLAMIPFIIIINGIGTLVGILSIRSGGNIETLNSIIQTVLIPSLTLLGGGYIANSYASTEGILSKIAYVSPLTWFNKGMFRAIYLEDFKMFNLWLIIGGVSLILFISIIYYLGKRSDEDYEKYSSFN